MEHTPNAREGFELELREITPDHWEMVRDLYLELVRIDPEAFADEYDVVAEQTEEDWRQGLERTGKTFIAMVDGKPVGMGRVNIWEEYLPGIPVLHKLGVLPEYRGRGIAKKLVAAREAWARAQGAKKIRLYVVANRVKTIEFSKKNGYHIVEQLEQGTQLSDGSWVPTVVMEKDLTE